VSSICWRQGSFAGNWLWRAEKLWRTCISVTLVLWNRKTASWISKLGSILQCILRTKRVSRTVLQGILVQICWTLLKKGDKEPFGSSLGWTWGLGNHGIRRSNGENVSRCWQNAQWSSLDLDLKILGIIT
jgi:hypothetical protein